MAHILITLKTLRAHGYRPTAGELTKKPIFTRRCVMQKSRNGSNIHRTPFVFNLSPSEASQLEHTDVTPSAGTCSVTGGGLISNCSHDQILRASPGYDMYGKTLQVIAVSSGQNSSSSLEPLKNVFQDKKV